MDVGSHYVDIGVTWVPLWDIGIPLWDHWVPLWDIGVTWVPYGTLGTLGAIMGPLGSPYGALGFHLSQIGIPSWGNRGPPTWALGHWVPFPGHWGHMGPFRGPLVSCCGDIGVTWVPLWGHWGPFMGHWGPIMGHWGHMGPFIGPLVPLGSLYVDVGCHYGDIGVTWVPLWDIGVTWVPLWDIGAIEVPLWGHWGHSMGPGVAVPPLNPLPPPRPPSAGRKRSWSWWPPCAWGTRWLLGTRCPLGPWWP